MQSVETSAGTAICAAPSRIASRRPCPSSRNRSIFSIVTVASSTRIPTANASTPSVMVLIVSPSKLRMITELRVDTGNRHPYRNRDYDHTSPASQKQQDHQCRQSRGDNSPADHSANCPTNEDPLLP